MKSRDSERILFCARTRSMAAWAGGFRAALAFAGTSHRKHRQLRGVKRRGSTKAHLYLPMNLDVGLRL